MWIKLIIWLKLYTFYKPVAGLFLAQVNMQYDMRYLATWGIDRVMVEGKVEKCIKKALLRWDNKKYKGSINKNLT